MNKKLYLIAGFLCFMPWVCFAIEQYFGKLAMPDSQDYIVLTKPTFGNALTIIECGALAIIFILFCAAAVKKQKSRWTIFLAALLFNLLSYPLVGLAGFFTSWGSTWTLQDRTIGSDGKKYYFLHQGVMFGPGFTHALARDENDNPFWFKAKILGSMSEDEEGVSILRPEPIKPTSDDAPFRVYSSSSGWVACFSNDKCDVAYNLKTKRAYTGYKLQKLPPNILVEDKTNSRK